MDGWSDSWAPLPKPSLRADSLHSGSFYVDNIRKITDEEVKRFEERGYLIGPQLLKPELIPLLRDEFQRLFSGHIDTAATPYEYEYWKKSVLKFTDLANQDVLKINNCWWINPNLRTVVLSKEVGKIGATLLRTRQVRLWHDQAIWKPSTIGVSDRGNIGWHQDYGYWQISNSPQMITAWIPLQDTNLENGGLRTIVGSHKWGLVPDSAKFFDKDLDQLKEKFSSYGSEWIDEPCVLKAGQAAFHHSLTFHASGPNFSSTPRLAITIHMMAEECRYQTGKCWHHNLRDMGPDVKEGDPFVGPAFPVLYSF